VDGATSVAGKASRNRNSTVGKPRNKHHKHHNPLIGTAFVHTVLDDHSRVAYAEIHDDETSTTAVAVLERAVAWFAVRGVCTHRVLSDSGSCYGRLGGQALLHRRVRPPQNLASLATRVQPSPTPHGDRQGPAPSAG